MADVFISYARPNAATAARIADELRTLGYSVWYDQHLPAHRSYADVIEEQLAAAAAVIVLWSADSAASQWVRSEANRARESGRLVQARLEDCALPMPFDQIQCADLRKWRGDRTAPGLLSFARPGTTLALDFPRRGPDVFDLLDRLDAIVAEAGGAIYPAKDARMSPAMFRRGQPRLDEFLPHIDPAFSSSFWRRVME